MIRTGADEVRAMTKDYWKEKTKVPYMEGH